MCFWSWLTAYAGASAPQIAPISRSRPIGRPDRISRVASTARRCAEPRSRISSPRRARSGPSSSKRKDIGIRLFPLQRAFQGLFQRVRPGSKQKATPRGGEMPNLTDYTVIQDTSVTLPKSNGDIDHDYPKFG